MSKKMILSYTVTKGSPADYVAEVYAAGIPGKTKAEPGCLRYEFFTSKETDIVILIEEWADDEALQGHINGDNIRVLREIKDRYGVITEPAI